MAKAVEYVNGVSGKVCHGDGVGGALALAGCEIASVMRQSILTLYTFFDAALVV